MSFSHKNEHLKFYLGIFIILLWALGFSLQTRRVINYDDSRSGLLMIATFFTNHANLFVFISTLLILLKIKNKHVDRFHYIAAVDITITGLVWLTLLLPFMPKVTFLQVLLHGIIPPIYMTFFLLSYKTSLRRKNAWIALIHPFLYFIFVYTIAHPLYGDYLYNLFPLEVDSYIYPFLNPAYFEHGLIGMLLVNYLILFPVAFLLSFVILLFKERVDARLA